MTKIPERLSKVDTILAMNSFGKRSVPFAFLISFSGEENFVLPLHEAEESGLIVSMPHMSTPPAGYTTTPARPDQPFRLRKQPVEPRQYQEAFDTVLREIRYGNTFLLNLTFPTMIRINYTMEEIYAFSMAPFRLLIPGKMVIFSPERFVRIRDTIISSNPMKGTIDAGIPGAYSLLKSDRKEHAEHNTIVDLIRNDISMVASRVRVSRFKYIEKLKTHTGGLLQMSSEITGKLPAGFRSSLGDLLFGMLPAGSVSGAPKQKTVEIIRRVEPCQRGYYTGIFGIFDGEELDSAVAIRYIERERDRHRFKSGGGITFQSQWELEYQEMIKKVYVPV